MDSFSGPTLKSGLPLTSSLQTLKPLETKSSISLSKTSVPSPSTLIKSEKTKKKPKKKFKVISDPKLVSQNDYDQESNNCEIPVYTLDHDVDQEVIEIPNFLPPEADILTLNRPLSDVHSVKQGFINVISASLIRAPDFKNATDSARLDFISAADSVYDHDAEFILKVALYTRCELNIRSTANFLLAYASNRPNCRSFMRKYFSASIRLPSDWIDVAEQYQVFHDKTIASGSIPSALRRAMVAKFPEFDKYQLAKYNKESSIKKKQKKDKKSGGSNQSARGRGRGGARGGRGRGRGIGRGRGRFEGSMHEIDTSSSSSDSSDDETAEKTDLVKFSFSVGSEPDEDLQQQRFTIKQLIRKLHITEPVEHVMSLIGKRYPETPEEFYKSRLPGIWDEMLAGKRMKLPIPETWETQVAMKGNKASTWEALLDHKKLPFMAMLRNLRNMIKAGISTKHHNLVLRKLTDESPQTKGVDVEEEEEEEGEEGGEEEVQNLWCKLLLEFTIHLPSFPLDSAVEYDPDVLKRYKKALDTSVKIATTFNITPIRGTTIILCDLTSAMLQPCTSGRGLGKPRNLMEVGVLLGLMCKHSCEECSMIVYGSSDHRTVDLEKGTILDNMESVIRLQTLLNSGSARPFPFPNDILTNILKDRSKIENLIILSAGLKMRSEEGRIVQDFLKKYRVMVNPDLLFANIDLSGGTAGVDAKMSSGHPNDISIAGYSDQILRWRTARVFISSTFRDMHGERDLLTRFVFPELRSRAEKRFLNVYEVDLRWGITEEDATNSKALELCLQELASCQFFVGMLGERYGWIPDAADFPSEPQFDYLRHLSGSSVTELEIEAGALSQVDEMREKAFLFFRDSTFETEIPKFWQQDFKAESSSNADKIHKLKSKIRSSGLEVYENYPCRWGGVVDGKPIMAGLESFASRVLNNLWNALQKFYPVEDGLVDEVIHTSGLHHAHGSRLRDNFVGRSPLLKQCLSALKENKHQLLLLIGKPGCGKSALMASLVQEYASSPSVCSSALCTLVHFVGAAPGSANVIAILRQLCSELIRRFALNKDIPQEFKNLVTVFAECLTEAASMCSSPLVLFMDGVDLLDDVHHARNMEWLPKELPQNVVFVISSKERTDTYSSLLRREHHLIQVGPLDMWEKALVVRENLARHRKQLDESAFNNQMKLLLAKREANLPLFLSLACEELRVFGVYEEISAKLRSMPHTLPLLLRDVLCRLESDHDPKIIASSLLFLLCSRSGLTESDLHHLLSLQEMFGREKMRLSDVANVFLKPECLMPRAKFSRILRSLACFMRPTSGDNHLLNLGHGDICQAVRQRYLTSNDLEQTIHSVIAAYYYSMADPNFDRTWNGKTRAAFAQLPHHLCCAAEYTELYDILSDLRFIEAKCVLGMASDLLEDFHLQTPKASKAQEREKARILATPRTQAFLTFISSNVHILSRFPQLCLQQAINESAESEVYRNAKEKVGEQSMSLIEWTNRPRVADPCVFTMYNPQERISTIAASKDNLCFAVGTFDNIVRLYDMQTCKELQSFVGHSDPITAICFTGSGLLCSASIDKTLSLWSLRDGHRIAVMKGHKRRVTACACNADWIVSVGWDAAVRIWDAKTGEGKGFLTGEPRPLNCVAFNPNSSNVIATGSWDSAIRMWDVFHKKRVAVLRGHQTSVRDLAFSPCGSYVASAALDGEVKLWSSFNGTQVGLLKGHHLPINKLCYDACGLRLITASDDCKIKVWSGHLGKILFSLSEEEGARGVSSTAFSPDGTRLACGCHEGHVLLYNVLSGCLLKTQKLHSAAVRALAFSPDGECIASGSDDASIRLFTGALLEGHTKPITCLAFGDRYLVSTSEDSETRIFRVIDLSGGKKQSLCQPKFVLRGHDGVISCCALNQDETQLVTGGRDMDIHIWDLESASEPFVASSLPACHADWINTVAWSNTGDFIVTGSNDFSLKLWDVKSQKEKLTLVGHTAIISHVAYKFGCIVSSSLDGTVKIWSHKGTEITTLHGHSQRVNGCDIHVQVEQIEEKNEEEISDWATEIELEEWKAKHDVNKLGKRDVKGNEIASLNGHSKAVASVSCSSNNNLCSSAINGEIKLWKIPRASEHCPSPHDAPVSAMAAFRSTLVTGSRDGSICIWTIDADSPKPQPKLTLQAHDKEVLAVALHFDTMATASMDCSIRLWSFKEVEGNFKILLKCTKKSPSPVTSLKSIPLTAFVVATQWAGDVSLLDMKIMKLKNISEYAGHADWILAADANYRTLVTCSADEKIKLIDFNSNENGIELNSKCTKVIKYNQGSKANWLTSVAVFDRWAVVGDLNGQLTKIDANSVVTKLAHNGAITACATNGSTIVTASADGTLKLWNPTLDQIGQFFCKSPVLSLHLMKQNNCCLLVTGDELGNVNFLRWKQD
ncbi:hypothetical protein CAPTEDRAFT_193037 [Capitella teleta]|uniref:TROVE domain-containing protein n=1 Tax=Capitella teleta TaxID=283909 RepID=R7UPJ1_CAPTE|nr:hypothetical protein CAPTEDRAFT_193037 [Capitella teleta]|eukprot:ELU05341.1 hypothetical protein CAPTEDRAFT_193037 [Capitella teleta]